MKRRSPRISAIFLILFFLSGCGLAIKNLNSQGKAIVCFGDSITLGVGSDPGGNYPDYLREMLGREIINSGVSGITTKEALGYLKEKVLDYNPYLVIVELGGNDFLNDIFKEETLKNMKEMVDRIQEKGAIVALCDVSGRVLLQRYKKGCRKIASETGSILIPGLLAGILEDPTLKYDTIHPNSKGYKIIAQRVYKAIKPYIK